MLQEALGAGEKFLLAGLLVDRLRSASKFYDVATDVSVQGNADRDMIGIKY